MIIGGGPKRIDLTDAFGQVSRCVVRGRRIERKLEEDEGSTPSRVNECERRGDGGGETRSGGEVDAGSSARGSLDYAGVVGMENRAVSAQLISGD
jgi:hypothetical protein